MNIAKTIAIVAALSMGGNFANAQTMIGKNDIKLASDAMTPEALWAMGRIGGAQASPDGKQVIYQVGYYSVKENKGHQMLFCMNSNGSNKRALTHSAKSETDAAWIEGGRKIAYLCDGQLWKMSPDGSNKQQLTHSDIDIEGFKFAPDGKQVILIKSIPYHGTIKQNPADLPKATGRLITDMNYRHWDHYVESIAHPFLAQVSDNQIDNGTDRPANPTSAPQLPLAASSR